MSTSAPLLRPPIPGSGRSNSGTRTPRLGLAIPPSPSARPINPDAQHGDEGKPPRPTPPTLSLNTPTPGGTGTHEGRTRPRMPALPIPSSQPTSDGPSRSRSSSEHPSATSSRSNVADGLPEIELPNLEALSLEKGRPLDVDDLDDSGWEAASKQGKIKELGGLGEGAGGAVTRCILQGGKTVFALKTITTDPNPDVLKQIMRELEFNKSCASEHICKYHGAFTDSSGTISIAMEFCEGGSLDSIYNEVRKLGGRTGQNVLGKVAEGVLKGLTYLHGCRIIHRDIKPSNILLCRDGQVKLCDFGVSGEFGTKGDANTFIGTSYYMAPERITGQSYTITSDVWSLGVTLLEVAQHRFPFPADGTEMQPKAGLIDLLTYIVRQPTPKLQDDSNVQYSQKFKSFIDYCLEKDGTKRPTPWNMLEHPWMEEIKTKKVKMDKFLREVWDWKD